MTRLEGTGDLPVLHSIGRTAISTQLETLPQADEETEEAGVPEATKARTRREQRCTAMLFVSWLCTGITPPGIPRTGSPSSTQPLESRSPRTGAAALPR